MKIGLAFEGGGGKGAYQIGVWKALRETGIDKHIDAVSGTSIGAMNAFLFAYGDYNLAKNIWLNLTPNMVFSNPGKGLLPWNLEGGIFTREGVEKIFEILDFNRVSKGNSIPCYATCLRIEDKKDMQTIVDFFGKTLTGVIMLTQIGNVATIGTLLNFLQRSSDPVCQAITRLLESSKPKYFKLHKHSVEIKKDILLASSAIPIIFPKHPIKGAYYIDGGLGDNLPIKPLIKKEGCDKVILVHCNRGSVIKKTYKNKILEIIPQESQNGMIGTLDFSQKVIRRRIQQGYQDAIEYLQEMRTSLEPVIQFEQENEQYTQLCIKSLEEDKKREKENAELDKKLEAYVKNHEK